MPMDRVKHLPWLITFGEQDTPVVEPSKQMAAAMKEAGIDVELLELKGQNHDTSVAAGAPSVFEFFNKHSPRKN
jgi:dipeptidyl aminopeptidase/acylaminoacyl peptidase